MSPKPKILASDGSTFGTEGEGRRIVIQNYPHQTNIQDIKNFFGPETVEAVTLYAHMAFVQFKRPSDFTEALLKNKNKLRGSQVDIRTYKKGDIYRKEKKVVDDKIEMERREKQRQRDKANNSYRQRRSRSRSRSPKRNRSPGGRGSRNGGRRSRSRSRSRDRSSRMSCDYDRRPYSSYEHERHHRYASSPRNDRYMSSSNGGGGGGGGYHTWPINQLPQHQQQLQHQQHQAVIRSEPMSGVHIMAPNQFSFGLNSGPISNFPGTMPLPTTKVEPPRPALSGPSEPVPNLQRIFSEHVTEKKTAFEPKLILPEPIVKKEEPKIPSHIDLLLKLILDQSSVQSLSMSHLQQLISYFTQVRDDLMSQPQPTRMPNALSKASLQVQPQQQALVAYASDNHSSQLSTCGEAPDEQVVNGNGTSENEPKQTNKKDQVIDRQELRNKILAK